ncbi:MAG: Verru_Chthon cassette protein D [Blastochloris sp.]|nr:Verru_Chthon cassette protein D [Blastochloris sp.]
MVELLAVITVIVILSLLAMPAFRSISGGNSITSGGLLVSGQLELARQTALAEGIQTEVRFYKIAGNTGLEAYRAMALVKVSTGEMLNKTQRLPEGVILSDNPVFSTILSNDNMDEGTQDLPGLPNTPYKSLRFTNGGSTTLNPLGAGSGASRDQWFVSVKAESAPEENNLPARNYSTVQVDPITGRTTIFRP